MKHLLSKGDYVVVTTSKEEGGFNKPQLLKIKTTSGDSNVGRLEKDPHIIESTVEFKSSEVLVNLGPDPKDGKVYGFDLSERFRGSKEHDFFGDIHFFTKPDAKHGEALWKGLDRASKRLKSAGLSTLPSKAIFEFEVFPKKGKYAGLYVHSGNTEKNLPRVKISIGDKTIEKASMGSYEYVVLHEFAHMFDFQFLSGYHELTAKWVDLHQRSLGPLKVSTEDCSRLVESALNKEASLKEFLADIDDEDKVKLKLIVKWIRDQKNVVPSDLNELFTHRSKRTERVIRELWPVVNLRSKRPKPLVTEYACVNRRELFAESLSFYLLDKELPQSVTTLVEESIQLGIKQLKA